MVNVGLTSKLFEPTVFALSNADGGATEAEQETWRRP